VTSALLLAALATGPTVSDDEPRYARPFIHATALFTTMRTVEVFLWPHPFAETHAIGQRWGETFTTAPRFDPKRRAFEWDGDAWYINAIGHSLLGMELHFRARTCGFGWAGSLAFTTGASAVWEYIFEGNAVRASALDLVWTPLAGLGLGEARYALFRAAPKSFFVRFLIDPLGGLDHAITNDACGW
jgi:hypothetical protein